MAKLGQRWLSGETRISTEGPGFFRPLGLGMLASVFLFVVCASSLSRAEVVPIARYVSPDLLTRIAVFQGVDHGNEITIRQCLNLEAMQQWSPQSAGHYGLGLDLYTTAAGDQLIGHGG